MTDREHRIRIPKRSHSLHLWDWFYVRSEGWVQACYLCFNRARKGKRA